MIVCNIGVDANGLDGLGAVQGEIEINNFLEISWLMLGIAWHPLVDGY